MYTCRLKTIFVALLFPLFACAGQSDSLFASFDNRFILLDKIIQNHSSYASPASPSSYTNKILTSSLPAVADSKLDNAITFRMNREISAMKSQTGLTVNGQVYTRLDNQFGLDEDDGESRYRSKIQAEVRWNFLNSSLLHRKGKTREIRLKAHIDRIEYKQEDLGRLVALQLEAFKNRYDSLLSGVLAHRIENLRLLTDAQEYLLTEGGIASDEILNILNDRAEAERTMAEIPKTYPLATDLSNPSGIIVSVDSVSLIKTIFDHNISSSTLELRKQLLEQQAKNNSYWSSLNISPFVRYSFYERPDISNSSNVDVGLSFIIPISGETSKKRKALLAQREVLDLEKSQIVDIISDRVRLALDDVNRLNRAIEGEVRRLAQLKGFLALRKKAYDNRIGEYNYMLRLKEYNSYLLCCERLLQFSYKRDCEIASLQSFLPDVSVLNFCSETELQAQSILPTSKSPRP